MFKGLFGGKERLIDLAHKDRARLTEIQGEITGHQQEIVNAREQEVKSRGFSSARSSIQASNDKITHLVNEGKEIRGE